MDSTLDINELMADMPAPIATVHTLTVGEGDAAWQMDYAVFGEGPKTLVILPGLSLKPVTPQAVPVSIHYAMFCRDYTVYLLDPRRDIPADYTLDAFADDTAAALAVLGVNRACFFGASMGGMVSQLLAIRYPQLVEAVALGSTACRHTDASRANALRWSSLATAAAAELTVSGTSTTAPEFARALVQNIYSEATQAQVGQFLLEANDGASAADYRKVATLTTAVADFDVYDALTGVTCPVLVLGASADKVVPPESSAQIAAQTGGQLYMYGPEFGHAAFDEAPDYTLRLFAFFQEATGE